MGKLLGIKEFCEFWQSIKGIFVKKAGDTMTGSLEIKESNIDVDTPPGSNTYGNALFTFVDKDGEYLGYLQPFYLPNVGGHNVIGMTVNGYREVNGSPVYNGLYLGVKDDGTPFVDFNTSADRDAWLKALHLDKVANVFSDTSTASDFFTVYSSNATISNFAVCAIYGKVAQVSFNWKNVNAITVPASGNISNITIGTLKTGYRPLNASVGWSNGEASAAWYNINSSGVVTLNALEGTGASRTIAASTEFRFSTVFILP